MSQENDNETEFSKDDLKAMAEQMQLQVAAIDVALPEPPSSPDALPAFMQVLIDALMSIDVALREQGSTAIAIKAVKFTQSPILPATGRGDLTLHVIRAKTPQPPINGLN